MKPISALVRQGGSATRERNLDKTGERNPNGPSPSSGSGPRAGRREVLDMIPKDEPADLATAVGMGFPGGGFPTDEYLHVRGAPDWPETEVRVATTASEILRDYLERNNVLPLSQQLTLRGSGKMKAINALIARRVVLGGIKLTRGDPVSIEILFGYRYPGRRRVRRRKFTSTAFTQFRHRLGINVKEVRVGWGLLPEEAAWLLQLTPFDGVPGPGHSMRQRCPTESLQGFLVTPGYLSVRATSRPVCD